MQSEAAAVGRQSLEDAPTAGVTSAAGAVVLSGPEVDDGSI